MTTTYLGIHAVVTASHGTQGVSLGPLTNADKYPVVAEAWMKSIKDGSRGVSGCWARQGMHAMRLLNRMESCGDAIVEAITVDGESLGTLGYLRRNGQFRPAM